MILKKILTDIIEERKRFLKFCVVGGSGVIVNLFFVWLGNVVVFATLSDSIRTPLAYALGIVTSIFTNFLFNHFWTWSDVQRGGARRFVVRMLKFYVVSSVAALVQFVVSNGLAFLAKFCIVKDAGVVPVSWKMFFALVGIGTGMLINFFMNHYWTFRKEDSPPQGP